MYIFLRPPTATSGARSINTRASSTLLCDAASISKTAGDLPSLISTHCVHFWQGSAVGPDSQFKHLARIRADEVLPQPRGPVNRYACDNRPCSMALVKVRCTAG